ncbi:MAG: HprK-related kinase B [Desulfonauticus sp.]|nr:HprK-related kinase B [Desulfonauticus sp.]
MKNTVSELIQEIRHKYPCEYDLYLEFGGTSFWIKANDGQIVKELAYYFKPFVKSEQESCEIIITVHQAPVPEFPFEFVAKQPDPGKSRIKEEYVELEDGRIVRKRLTGMVFLFGNGEHLAIGPCLENLNQVINFINNRYIEIKLLEGCLLGHAAAILWKGKGLALAGFAGMGKSTFALHLMSRGAVFVSNDRLLVQEEESSLKMFGVPKLPRINPGTALNNPNLHSILSEEEKKHFSSLPTEELWKIEQKYDVFIDKCFGEDRFVLGGPMHALAILNWDFKQEARAHLEVVDLAKRRDLLQAFMKSPGLFFLPPKGKHIDFSEQRYMDVLAKCVVVEVKGKINFDLAVDACLEFLENL